MADPAGHAAVTGLLASISQSLHTDALISNGFDTVESLAVMEMEDASAMDIPRGHARLIIAAAKQVPFFFFFFFFFFFCRQD